MSDRHNVFISFHHENDESYKRIFQCRFGNKFGVVVPGAVQTGDIDPNRQTETIRRIIRDEYLRDTSVTVVLIGAQTWQRKHVDWEISSSIRDTKNNLDCLGCCCRLIRHLPRAVTTREPSRRDYTTIFGVGSQALQTGARTQKSSKLSFTTHT